MYPPELDGIPLALEEEPTPELYGLLDDAVGPASELLDDRLGPELLDEGLGPVSELLYPTPEDELTPELYGRLLDDMTGPVSELLYPPPVPVGPALDVEFDSG